MSTSSSPENAAEQAPAKHPVALIAGPTASGKSDLAIRLAKAIEANGRNAAIVNADSAQVYADLRVVSARPSRAEMDAVEHRLFGAWDAAQPCSAADWARAARAEIDSLHAAGTVPILVGGTGMYIRTLLDGIASIPAIDPAIRDDVRSMTAEAAYAALQAEDPQRADILAPGDRQRVARALEVVRSTGRPLHAWQKTNSGGIADRITLHPLILLPERDWLYNRCDSRFEAMLASGAIEEVEALLARKLDPALPIMRAIGVPEIASWLRGETSRQEMIAAGQQATRNYAKRQYTWFRRQAPQHWPRLESQNYDIEIIFNGLLQN